MKAAKPASKKSPLKMSIGGMSRMVAPVNPGAVVATKGISNASSETGGALSPGGSFKRRAPDLAPRPVPRAMSTAGRAMRLPAGAKEDADDGGNKRKIGILPMDNMKKMAKGGAVTKASKQKKK